MTDFERLKERIKNFNLERDWDKYHNPKDVLLALVSEVGELSECYRWLSHAEVEKVHADPVKRKVIEEELADIFIYLIILGYKMNVDLAKIIEEKLVKNETRYSVDKIKGKHTNPIEGIKN